MFAACMASCTRRHGCTFGPPSSPWQTYSVGVSAISSFRSWRSSDQGDSRLGRFEHASGSVTDDPTQQLPPEPPRDCPNCGSSVPPGSEFCPACGANLRPKRSRAWPLVLVGIVAAAAGVGIALAVSNGGGSTTTLTRPVTSTVTTSQSTSVTVKTPTHTVTAPPSTVTVTAPTTPT